MGRHLDDIYELFLLGTLPGEDAAAVRDHIERDCSHCLVQLREATEAVYLLGLMTPRARLDPKQKSQLLRRVSKGGSKHSSTG
jgi:hypothetical protein